MMYLLDQKVTEERGIIVRSFIRSFRRKFILFLSLLVAVFIVSLFSVSMGSVNIPLKEVFSALTDNRSSEAQMVVMNIRLPRVIAAIVTGWGLSLSGLSIQSLLKNPLGSASTLGISQGAAFGAAVAIVFLGARMASVTLFAFGGSMAATFIILLLSGLRRLSVEAMILAGVALSSLFVSATILIQYLATETQLVMTVFWTFGDVARSSWREIGILSLFLVLVTFYLIFIRWDLNALASGEEIAKGLGVNVKRIRITGMVAAALISALSTAFHGVISFIGLIAPHMARRLVGDDHSLLIPVSSVIGALLLLGADTMGRILIGSGSLPVGVITSFLGAPMFLYLLIRGYR